jgi:hypothetical protein
MERGIKFGRYIMGGGQCMSTELKGSEFAAFI